MDGGWNRIKFANRLKRSERRRERKREWHAYEMIKA